MKYLKRLFCKHEYDCDKQIKILICHKCGSKSWIRHFKNLFT